MNTRHQDHQWFWFSAVLALFCLILYGNTLSNGYALDDKFIITENKFTQRGFEGIPDLLTSSYWKGKEANVRSYRPLAPVTFAAEIGLWGQNPEASHLINLVLYMITGLILLQLIRKAFYLTDPGIPPVVSLVVTLLFLAHPVHTEVVANIKSRDAILECLFLFSCALFLLNYLKNNKPIHIISSILAFFLALFSKESAIAFIFLPPLIVLLFSRKSFLKTVRISILFLIPVFIYVFLYISFSGYQEFGEMHFLNNILASEAPLITIWATKFYLLGKYLFLLIFPYPLLYDYSYNQIPLTGLSNPAVWISFMVYLSAMVYLFFIIFRKIANKNVSPDKILAAFAIAWFFMGLFVSSNLVMLIGSTMGERFLYIPSLGFVLVAVVGLFRIVTRQRIVKVSARFNMIMFYCLVLILLTGYSVKTIIRNQSWKDDFALCSGDIRYLGNNVKANVFLAYLYRQKGDQATDSVLRAGYYLQAIDFNEKALSIYGELSEVVQAQGFLYGTVGNFEKAAVHYQQAIKLNPENVPNYVQAGKAFGMMKQFGKGIEFLLMGVKLDSNNTALLSLLGIFYAETGDLNQAVFWFEKLLKKEPENSQARAYIDWVNKRNNIKRHEI